MTKHTNLSLLEIDSKLEAAKEINYNLISEGVYTIVFFAVLILVLIFITVVDSNMPKLKRLAMGIPLAFLIIIGVGTLVKGIVDKVNIEKEINQLTEERKELKYDIYNKNKLLIEDFTRNETEVITLKDIVSKVNVPDDYCPSLKGTEECYFIEFVSNAQFSQATVPFNENSLVGSENGLQLKYYVLNGEEFELYKNQFNLENNAYVDNKVYIDRFVIGDSLLK